MYHTPHTLHSIGLFSLILSTRTQYPPSNLNYYFRESEFVIEECWKDSWYPDLFIMLYYNTETGETDIIGRRNWRMKK
jgi:hypothetical protein